MFYVEIENIIDNQTKILCSLLNQTFELLGREGHLVVIISLKLVLNDVIFLATYLPTFDKVTSSSSGFKTSCNLKLQLTMVSKISAIIKEIELSSTAGAARCDFLCNLYCNGVAHPWKSIEVTNRCTFRVFWGEGWQAVFLGDGVTVMEERKILVGWVTKVCFKCT